MPDNNNNLIVQTLFQVKEQIGASDAKNDAILRKLDSIEEQTTKTNGRVTALEQKVNVDDARKKMRDHIWTAVWILGSNALTWAILGLHK